MGKLALSEPDGTVMVGGTTAKRLLDDSEMAKPPDPAALLN